MVGTNFEKLSYILKKLEEIDPILLDQLNYYYEKLVPINGKDDVEFSDEDLEEEAQTDGSDTRGILDVSAD